MRKALTVLLLLVAVIGLAFAGNDETSQPNTTSSNTITLKTIIGQKLPVFNLRASYGSVTVDTNTDNITFSDGAYYSAVLTIADDISMKDVSQTFEIFSNSRAKYNGGFEFTVEASAFSAPSDDNPDSPKYTTKGNISYNYLGNGNVNTHYNNISVSVAENKITANFSGSVDENIKIGEVVITWPKDPAAVPGDYNADVIMTVKTK